MLRFTVPAGEFYDERTNSFAYNDETELQLEHSLSAVAQWESKWKKPFLSQAKKHEKTVDEMYDYFRCMTVNGPFEPIVYRSLTQAQFAVITAYIQDSATATTFSEHDQKKFFNQTITAEVIYYWMTALNIPFVPCESWNLNRLLALIRVCSIKSQSPKKKPKREAYREQAELNAKRLAQYNTRG